MLLEQAGELWHSIFISNVDTGTATIVKYCQVFIQSKTVICCLGNDLIRLNLSYWFFSGRMFFSFKTISKT